MSSQAERAYDRARKAALWARWRALGCCGTCGVPIERFSKCLPCRCRYARRNIVWYRKKQERARAAA